MFSLCFHHRSATDRTAIPAMRGSSRSQSTMGVAALAMSADRDE